jgi:hypothetical protein
MGEEAVVERAGSEAGFERNCGVGIERSWERKYERRNLGGNASSTIHAKFLEATTCAHRVDGELGWIALGWL